jgi:hypothetical protein
VPWNERAAHASRMSARSVRPSCRRRLGVVGVVVLLVGVAAGAAWQLNEMHEADTALSRLSDTNPVIGSGDLPAGNPSATGTVLPPPVVEASQAPAPPPVAPVRVSPEPTVQRSNATPPVAAAAPPASSPVPSAGTSLAGANPPALPNTPREACGARTEFALYRCMQNQCSQSQWRRHPQCNSFRVNEGLPE